MRASVLRIVLLFVTSLTFGAPTPNASAAEPASKPTSKTLLVLGDSLSAGYGLQPGEGWVDLLAARLKKDAPGWRVENASVSGDTTTNGLARLPGALKEHRPAIVIIELGGNDALRGTPPLAIRKNLVSLVTSAKNAGAKVLLVEMRILPNYGQKYVERFHAQYAEVAKETGAILIPKFLDEVGTKPEWMQADGIHPNAKGQPGLLKAVWGVLVTHFRVS